MRDACRLPHGRVSRQRPGCRCGGSASMARPLIGIDSDHHAIGTGAEQHGGRGSNGCAPDPPGLRAGVLRLQHGLQRDRQLFGSSNAPAQGQPGYVQGFLGGAVADEPRAALAAREILSAGGNAADAAVALGFALSVTLPSRAGLGGGGACLAYAADKKSANAGVPEAVLFTPVAPPASAPTPTGPPRCRCWPAGLYLLHARYGHLPFESLIVPAEQLARFGTPASRALVRDLASGRRPAAGRSERAGGVLAGRPAARRGPAVHAAGPGGDADAAPGFRRRRSLHRRAGETDRAGLATGRRTAHAGAICAARCRAWRRPSCCRTATTTWHSCRRRPMADWPPPPASCRVAARSLRIRRGGGAGARSRGALAAGRRRCARRCSHGVDLQEAPLPPLPASTSFVTLDKDGNAVACTLSMDNLFGTGRVLPGLGVLLAASPAAVPRAAVLGGDRLEREYACVPRRGRRLRPGGRADSGRRRHAERVAHQPADGRRRAGSGACQCDLLQPLSAGRERLLRLGGGPARIGLAAGGS